MNLKKPAFVIITSTIAIIAAVQLLIPRSTAYTPVVPPPSAEPVSVSAWSRDLPAGQSRAGKEHKEILLVFGDSDPASGTPNVEATLNDPHFLAEAAKQFVLVYFPSSGDLSAGDLTCRATWAEKLGVSALPSAFVLDDRGRAVGSSTSLVGGPEKLLETFRRFAQIRSDRDAAFAAAEKATGIEKARHLDEGLKLVGDCKRAGYLDVMSQIVELDPDNVAGLRGRYQEFVSGAKIDAAIQNEIYPLIDQHQFLPAIDRIEKLIGQQSPSPAQKQMLLAFQGQLYQSASDKSKAVASLDRALALDPNSTAAPQIRKARAHLTEDDQ